MLLEIYSCSDFEMNKADLNGFALGSFLRSGKFGQEN